ncbi:MAG: putative sensor protein [Modestobacter sp.]|nr:putative sensor protein [Modestobacter sp.]
MVTIDGADRPGEPAGARAPGSAAAAAALRIADEARVRAARRLVPDADRLPALSRIADLAAELLGTAAAQVSLLDDEQLVAGGAGAAAGAVGNRGPLEESLCTVTAASPGPLAVADAPEDDRVSDLPPVTSGAVGAYLGAPLVDDEGHVVGVLCVFDPTPRQWSDTDVAVLRQLANSVTTELQLAALIGDYETSRLRAELAMDAAELGTFDLDARTGRLSWDERLMRMFGYEPATFDETLAAFSARVHPDDLARADDALQRAIATGGEYVVEYRVCLPGGGTRWVSARGRAVTDGTGRTTRVVGAAYDTTRERAVETRVSRLLEAMPAGFYSLDAEWRFTHVNAEAERLLGRPREELLGTVLWEEFPAARDGVFEDSYRRAVASGEPVSFEAYYPAPLDGWYELRAWPTPEGLSVYFLEVTARRAAQQQAERSAVRLALLARASAELSGTLDAQTAIARLPRLVVPALADWCIVTVIGPDGVARDVGSWHADPAGQELVRRYAAVRLAAMPVDAPVARALRTGAPVVSSADEITGMLPPGEARELLALIAPRSVVALPLRARGRTLGLLTLSYADGHVPTDDDVATAQDVADRAGLALDNARLYHQQLQLAEGLQRSLLTAPPEPDSAEIVVRYLPATEAARVGGDWYDAFLQPGGSTMLVIGDVVGHDTAAAAAMGQLRSLLRGIATYSDAGPAEVLRGLDSSMALLQVDTLATAMIARFEQTPDERSRGVTRMRWANAGHLPPLAVTPDGTVTVLADWRADLLLGVDATVQRTERLVTLDHGATVLLYTDGLIERRDSDLDTGLGRLREALGDLAARPLPELCDELIARLVDGRPEDDVALVAIRLRAVAPG